MKKFIFTILLLITISEAKESSYSLEINYLNAILLGTQGVEIKGDISLLNNGIFESDIGLGAIYNNAGSIEYGNSVQTLSVNTYEGGNLNLYLDTRLYMTDSFYWITNVYIGWMYWHINESYKSSASSINASADEYFNYFDYGAELGVGYEFNDNWGMTFLVYKSLRNILEPLSPLLHLIGSMDAPTRAQLGLRYIF